MTLDVACRPFEGRSHLVEALRDDPAIRLVLCDDEATTLAAIADCGVLVLGGSQYTKAVADRLLAGSHRVEWIQFASAGVDNAARYGVPSGIVLTNAAAAIAPTVAEHAMAMLLAGKRQLVAIDRVRDRSLSRERFIPALSSLDGQSMLIVGYGNIGREIARRARAFGMQVWSATRRPQAVGDEGVVAHPLADLDDLLPRADAVVLSLALTRETRHLFGASQFDRMKRSAWLVNIARGDLVDQAALIEALRTGKLAGAALDVTDVEPLPADSPLRAMTNVIVTPHLAGFGSESTQHRLAAAVEANLRRRITGLPLDNRIEPASLASL